MITTGFLMKKMLKNDAIATSILLALAVHAAIILGNFNVAGIKYFCIDAAILAVIVTSVQIYIRYRKISAIMKSFIDPDSDIRNLKVRIITYPRFEGLIHIFRWGIGVPIVVMLLYFQIELTVENLIPFAILLPVMIINNSIIAYLGIENILSALLQQPRLSSCVIELKGLKILTLNSRMLLVIISVVSIPLVILGYLLFLGNSGNLKINNIGYHILFVLVLSAVAVTVLVIEMYWNNQRSITTMISALQMITEGDLTVESVPMLALSEIGNVSQHVTILLLKLKDIIIKVKKSSGIVSSSSQNITGAAQSLSQSSSEQATSVEEITTSMEEMTSMIAQNTQNAKKTDEIARLSADQAAEGGKAVGETVEAMRQIRQKVGLIEEIAAKTDLLALNAAIEAARGRVRQGVCRGRVGDTEACGKKPGVREGDRRSYRQER